MFDRQTDKQASRQLANMEDADGQNTITPAVRISLSLLIILLIFIIIIPQYNYLSKPPLTNFPSIPPARNPRSSSNSNRHRLRLRRRRIRSVRPPLLTSPSPLINSYPEKAKQHPSHPPSPPSATKTVDAMLPTKKNIGLRMTKIKMINWILLIIFFCCCWMGNCIWRP